jgi:hypothetical protein
VSTEESSAQRDSTCIVTGLSRQLNQIDRLTPNPTSRATKELVDLADVALPQELLDAIQDHIRSLSSVLGIIRCIGTSIIDVAEDRAPEFSAAFVLVEQEIQRMVASLGKVLARAPDE